MIHVFSGHDPREAIGWHVFAASLLDRATKPVALHRLDACGLPQGSNAFTLSRFLVPYFMGFKGRAIFMDGADMLMLGDIAELDALFDPRFAVQVVKHEYKTRNPRKYLGTAMECDNPDYERKNWASVMLINCGHSMWRWANPALLPARKTLSTLQVRWLFDDEIGALPDEWNRLVDEGQPLEGAKVAHFTVGVPCFPQCGGVPGADLWFEQLRKLQAGLPHPPPPAPPRYIEVTRPVDAIAAQWLSPPSAT